MILRVKGLTHFQRNVKQTEGRIIKQTLANQNNKLNVVSKRLYLSPLCPMVSPVENSATAGS